jgi:hypothetical protein
MLRDATFCSSTIYRAGVVGGWRIVRPEVDKSETEVDQIRGCWRQHTQLVTQRLDKKGLLSKKVIYFLFRNLPDTFQASCLGCLVHSKKAISFLYRNLPGTFLESYFFPV